MLLESVLDIPVPLEIKKWKSSSQIKGSCVYFWDTWPNIIPVATCIRSTFFISQAFGECHMQPMKIIKSGDIVNKVTR